MEKIRIGILGYGNLGRGVEAAVLQNPDMELAGVFTRRNPGDIASNAAVYAADQLAKMEGKLDVLILCGGSATDLPIQSPQMAKQFHIVDSYDNHSQIPAHFDACDKSAKETGHIALISTGWDPGMCMRTDSGCRSEAWKKEQSLLRTKKYRPDLLD